MVRPSLSLTLRCFAGGAALLALAQEARAQFPNGPCWDSNLGTSLGLTDDSTTGPVALPFAFPLPGGGTTSSIDISSNGFVWLDSSNTLNNGYDLSESVTDLLTLGPRIAVNWRDLTPAAGTTFPGGAVYLNTTYPNRAVITWQVRDFGYENPVNAQLQLNSDGSFSIKFRDFPNPPTNCLIGVSPGAGAADPGASDFTQPVLSGGGWTLYQSGRNPALAGRGLLFLPMGNGYTFANLPTCYEPPSSVTVYGTGCPTPMGGSIFEHFTGGADAFDLPAGSSILYTKTSSGYAVTNGPMNAYDTNIGSQVSWGTGTGDDSLSPQTLPFAFPLPSGGTTTAIDVCSNGYVWLVSGSTTSTTYTPSEADFTSSTNPARIAALWTDLNNSTSGGGTVAFTANANQATITWDQVPMFSTSATSTVQLRLFASGDFRVVYQSVNLATGGIVADEALIGLTIGNNSSTPPETDFSTQLPTFMSSAQTSRVTLGAAAGSKPMLGANFTWELTNLNGSPVAVLMAGLTQQSLALDSIGMTGCTLYATPDAQAPMTVGGGMGSFTLPVPNIPALAGGHVFSQAVIIAPVNPFGLAASNGLDLMLGGY